jgi:hypothetical protein
MSSSSSKLSLLSPLYNSKILIVSNPTAVQEKERITRLIKESSYGISFYKDRLGLEFEKIEGKVRLPTHYPITKTEDDRLRFGMTNIY